LLDQADLFGQSRVPLYILNVAYPLVEEEVLRFCRGKKAIVMIEEGQPDYHEQSINTILRRHGVGTVVHGKDLLPMGGDYTVTALQKGIRNFLERWHPATFAMAVPVGFNLQSKQAATPTKYAQVAIKTIVPLNAITPGLLPPRPPGLCVGCPERPIFSSLKLVEQTLGSHHVSADIGCHLFSIMPPFNLGATTMGYGLGAASASAFNAGGMLGASKRAIAFMGDGGFWHNGLTSGIANAVFNKHDNVFVIVDNNYTAATGGQDIPSSRVDNPHRSAMHAIEQAVRGVGVEWVRTLPNTYDVKTMRATLQEALTTEALGPKVIVAQSECMLNLQRREKPQKAAAIKSGQRIVKERFGVDAAVCSGDHACMRVSGCPSLTLAPSGDALKPDPVAYVDEHCVACGHCGEVADAAVLCPSFYKAFKVHNPSGWERLVHRLRSSVLSWMRTRELAHRSHFALYPLARARPPKEAV
jgi:indolepyruvate ferredoxin oxidoreductase alpha subunit